MSFYGDALFVDPCDLEHLASFSVVLVLSEDELSFALFARDHIQAQPKLPIKYTLIDLFASYERCNFVPIVDFRLNDPRRFVPPVTL